MGIGAPRMEHLVTAQINRATDESFNLADRIGNCWNNIGLTLGIEHDVLEGIRSNNGNNPERLQNVFNRWLGNAAGLPNHHLYPLSWQGLKTLLEDCQKKEVAKQYFEFIGKMEY